MASVEKAHAIPIKEVLAALRSSEDGLSEEKKAERLREQGYNELKEAPKRSLLAMFVEQFAGVMMLILIIATVIAALLGEWLDASAIAAILVFNAALGTIQEYRAEKAIEALRRMVAPTARVLREGRERRIPAREIVAGDVIVLEAGDRVPADCRLIETTALETNEAPLTGESTPVKKNAQKVLPFTSPIAERSNMCLMGTTVTNGRGRGVVVATGMRTEFGKIAQRVQEVTVEETPLKQSLEKFGKQMAIAVVIGCAFIFSFGTLRGIPAFQMFLTSVSLAVAAIPEGLPAVMTIAMALGVQRMSKRNAIIRRLFAVETLGSANVILTDKTGTLTKNEMTAKRIYTSLEWYDVTGVGYDETGEFLQDGEKVNVPEKPDLEALLEIAVLCNHASLVYDKAKKALSAAGDPTEAALLVLAHKAGLHRHELKRTRRFIAEFPFDSVRKRMTLVYEKNGLTSALTKGALELVLPRCTKILVDGKERTLAAKDKASILKANRELASNALRVLAFAKRNFRPKAGELHIEDIERNLTFVGLVGLIDAPREEVSTAIELCKQAGIDVVMITGDSEITAKAVASKIGMLSKKDLVISGDELDKMDDAELAGKVERIRVYARVAPEHKLRVVEAWKRKGKVVAVTGDGVNDALALKRSDIGVAMGVTGTDVAKEVSDVVLADDNFASVVNAVEEGRGIYENIRKCVFFILPSNIAEVIIVFLVMMLGFPLPLTAIQILWINLVTETIPAFALAVDPIEAKVMGKPPRPQKETIWKGGRVYLFDYSLILVVFGVFLFASAFQAGGLVKAQTMVLTLIVAAEAYRAFSCRSLTEPVGKKLFGNKWLVLTVLLMFTLQLAVLYLPPLSAALHVTSLSLEELTTVLGIALASVLYVEAYKAFASARERTPAKL